MTGSQKLTLATLGVVALAVLGFIAYSLFSANNLSVAAPESGYADQPTLGRADAPVKLILFENFLCDHCAGFEAEAFPQLKRDYIDTGKVEVYYVNLAWGEERAELAGLAGECAYRQDRAAFWTYKSALYEAQTAWQDIGDLTRLAQDVTPLDASELSTCIETAQYQAEVQRDLDLAERVGVTGTPTLVLGDQGFEAPSYTELARAIDAQLNGG